MLRKYIFLIVIPLIGIATAGCAGSTIVVGTTPQVSPSGGTHTLNDPQKTSDSFFHENTPSKTVSVNPSPSETKDDPDKDDRTILEFLKTAALPLGHTMYVWGGGWNEEDTGAGVEARSIGVSPRWAEFAKEQSSSYDYTQTRYQIHDGLDCSGYVGWVVYNTFEKENGREGYVVKSSQMAKNYADRGWGTYTDANEVTDYLPGDILSGNGHVWICVGQCPDGSVVLLHASPPGVVLSGTLLENGEKSEAVRLAEEYTARYFPEWYEKFPNSSRTGDYLKNYNRMRWNRKTLSDPHGICSMGAKEVLSLIFGA